MGPHLMEGAVAWSGEGPPDALTIALFPYSVYAAVYDGQPLKLPAALLDRQYPAPVAYPHSCEFGGVAPGHFMATAYVRHPTTRAGRSSDGSRWR